MENEIKGLEQEREKLIKDTEELEAEKSKLEVEVENLEEREKEMVKSFDKINDIVRYWL